MSSTPTFVLVLLALFAPSALAQVAVTDAWVRGTVAGQGATGAFMQLTSPSATTLIAASSPAAKTVEIHEMSMDGSVMKMRAIDKLPLAAGQPVALKPGGYHVMLVGLAKPLQEGDTVALTLTFADKDGKKTTQQVAAPVRALTSTGSTAAGGSTAHKH